MDFHRIDVDFLNSQWNGDFLEVDIKHSNSYFLSGKTLGTAEVLSEVTYSEVYPGVDIRFFSSDGKFKYDVICQNREAMEQVRLRFQGAPGLLDGGALKLSTRFGEVMESIPVSFMCSNEERSEVKVLPLWDAGVSELSFGFAGAWPDGAHLVIDPAPQRMWSTYVGGGGRDELYRVATDAVGNIYTAGFTTSGSNIATIGAYQGTLIGFQNCFLMKYSFDGQKLYGTYFGGSAADRCYAMRLDETNGHIYIGGSTFSSNIGSPNVHQPLPASVDDAFLAKFDMQGQLVWCTYFGGADHDFIADIDLDLFGHPVVTGHTRSTTGISTDLTVLPGNENAFIAKFTTDGFQMWGTYFGGWFDEGLGIALDENDDIYICGITSSTVGISTPGAHQVANGGGLDAFLVKYSAAGERLWGTYIGGAGGDKATAVAMMPDGSVAVVGDTESPTGIASPAAHQPQPGSIDDSFVARFASNGTRIWGTYLGGGGVEYLNAVKITTEGNLLVAGQSESAENIASELAFQPQPAGEYDAILVSLSSDGDFLWGTYLGGPLLDVAHDLAIDPMTGHAIIGGMTRSASAIASPGAGEEVFQGGLYDGFMAKLCIPVRSAVQPLDGTLLCGDGELRFHLDPEPSHAVWQNGDEGLILTLTMNDEGMQAVHATMLDTNGCDSWSDTLAVASFPAFDSVIGLNVSPGTGTCLGSGYYLTVAPQFDSLLWWDGSTGLSAGFLPMDTMPYQLYVTVLDENGCSATDSVVIQSLLCLGQEGMDDFSPWILVPNPSDGMVVLRGQGRSEGGIQVEVFTVDGRLVHAATMPSGEASELPVPSGFYLIRVTEGYGRSHHFRHVVR